MSMLCWMADICTVPYSAEAVTGSKRTWNPGSAGMLGVAVMSRTMFTSILTNTYQKKEEKSAQFSPQKKTSEFQHRL